MALGYREEQIDGAGGFHANIPWIERTRAESDEPIRQWDVVGEAVEDRALDARLLVLSDPQVRAHDLIALIGMTRAGIGVAHEGQIRALRFHIPSVKQTVMDTPNWVELRVPTLDHVEVEYVPNKPAYIGTFDPVAVRSAIRQYIKERYDWKPVDILLGPDLDVQQLVDAIVAVDQAGAHAIGLGRMPDAKQLELRRKPIPMFKQVYLHIVGDLDKAKVGETLVSQRDALRGCHLEAFKVTPTMEGELRFDLTIDRTGKPTRVSSSGVDDKLSACVGDVIRNAKFPRPKSKTAEIYVRVAVGPNLKQRVK
jgi:hypothetical protein